MRANRASRLANRCIRRSCASHPETAGRARRSRMSKGAFAWICMAMSPRTCAWRDVVDPVCERSLVVPERHPDLSRFLRPCDLLDEFEVRRVFLDAQEAEREASGRHRA